MFLFDLLLYHLFYRSYIKRFVSFYLFFIKCMNIYIELAGGRREDDADCNRWDNLHIIVADCILDKLKSLYGPVFEIN